MSGAAFRSAWLYLADIDSPDLEATGPGPQGCASTEGSRWEPVPGLSTSAAAASSGRSPQLSIHVGSLWVPLSQVLSCELLALACDYPPSWLLPR